MIKQFQPIAGVPPTIDAWQFVPLPGNETNDVSMGAKIGAGPRSIATLLAVPSQALVGHYQSSYGGDLYERLHISTASIDLGNVIGLQQRTLTVWNAYTRAQVLAAIIEHGTEGLELAGKPGVLPYQFGPLQEDAYTLKIGTSGPPTIDAIYTWDFAPYDLVLRVVGSRVTAWSFAPDWTNSIVERIEWKTDVMQAYNAKEQRGQLRLGPRKSYEFEAFFQGKERRYAEALLWGWGARVWALPIWPDGVDLGATLPAGSTAVAISTATRDYEAGSLAIILQDALTYEVLEVDSVHPHSLALKRPTKRGWPGSARIYPARLGRIMERIDLPRWSGQASGIRVIFDIVGPVDFTPAAGGPTYRGRPVLTIRPNWRGGFDLEMARKLALVDNMTGGLAYDDESGLPTLRQRMRWQLSSRTEQAVFRGQLYALGGRARSIWVPSWTDDLRVVVQIPNGATYLDVEWSGYTQQIDRAVGRRDIRIELIDGTVLYRRITGAQELNADTERLLLDAPIPQTIPAANVLQVSYMTLCRLDSDAVEIAHWTGDTAESATIWRSFVTDI